MNRLALQTYISMALLQLAGLHFACACSVSIDRASEVREWRSAVFPLRRGGTGPILAVHHLRSGKGGCLATCSLCRLMIENLPRCLLKCTLYMMAPIRVEAALSIAILALLSFPHLAPLESRRLFFFLPGPNSDLLRRRRCWPEKR